MVRDFYGMRMVQFILRVFNRLAGKVGRGSVPFITFDRSKNGTVLFSKYLMEV